MSANVGKIKKDDFIYEDQRVRVLNRNGFTACKLIGTSSLLPDVLAGDSESIMIFHIETTKDSHIHIKKRKVRV